MSKRTKFFGGKGLGVPIGDAAGDPIGTVRSAPDGRWLAIMWPSRPSPYTWAVTDMHGSAGYETPERVAHWPVVGVVPFSPAAGVQLKDHKKFKQTDGQKRATQVLKKAQPRTMINTVVTKGGVL